MSSSGQITDPLSAGFTNSLQPGSFHTLYIEKLVAGGAGLARLDGQVVFCLHTLPGELVRVEILKGRKGVWYGKALEILEPHESRCKSPCSYVGTCGGCQLQHIPYAVQIEQKTCLLQEVFRRIGKQTETPIDPIVPSPLPLGYRYAIRLAVGQGKHNKVLGLFEAAGHTICPIDQCLLAVEDMHPIVKGVEGILAECPLSHGFLVNVEIRWSDYEAGGQVILRGLANGDTKHSVILDRLSQVPSVRGVVYEWLDPRDASHRKRSTQFMPLVRGRDHLWQSYLGFKIKVGFRSFLQANWQTFELLGRDLLKRIENLSGARILELYSGVSPLGMVLARAGAKMTCVEISKWAVEDARASVAGNGIHGCRVKEAAAESYLKTVQPGQFDGMLLDPPRVGLTNEVLDRVTESGVPRLWYLSCDMPTLARDVKRLCDGGYRVQRVQPYDMFPQTAQLETLVTLCR
ncbi:MAG: 23S rRNA (uracil(1939)-C(5))-methyltransferase RlmD [Nitrospirales bacterium]|nr:23S rRNA (uracil(1939)-C(5))-methyltransferase RlmD [Nitrospirales bacterium]